MKTWPKWIRWTIVIVGYVVAILLCLGGTTAIGGVPLGIGMIALQRSLDISID